MSVDLESHLDELLLKDEHAFEIIYQNTRYSVFAVIRSVVRDPSVTEDLMQDTYVRMMEKLNGYRRGANFNAWLTQIAKNIAYDHLRRTGREVRMDPAAHPRLFDPTVPSESRGIDFDALMAELPETERTIVMLRVVGERPFKEIAKLTGKSVGSVHKIYRQAIAKLAKNL